MEYQDYIQMGLEDKAPLKIILCGEVQKEENKKVGVFSVVFATQDKELAARKIQEFTEQYPEKYYMVYGVPLDTDLSTLKHYPSLAITKEDLQ